MKFSAIRSIATVAVFAFSTLPASCRPLDSSELTQLIMSRYQSVCVPGIGCKPALQQSPSDEAILRQRLVDNRAASSEALAARLSEEDPLLQSSVASLLGSLAEHSDFSLSAEARAQVLQVIKDKPSPLGIVKAGPLLETRITLLKFLSKLRPMTKETKEGVLSLLTIQEAADSPEMMSDLVLGAEAASCLGNAFAVERGEPNKEIAQLMHDKLQRSLSDSSKRLERERAKVAPVVKEHQELLERAIASEPTLFEQYKNAEASKNVNETERLARKIDFLTAPFREDFETIKEKLDREELWFKSEERPYSNFQIAIIKSLTHNSELSEIAVGALESALNSNDTEVQRAALERFVALGESASQAAPHVIKVLESSSDKEIKRNCITALQALGPRAGRALEAVNKAKYDKDLQGSADYCLQVWRNSHLIP